MKLFLKRDTSNETSRFLVFDDMGKEKYIIVGKSKNSKQTMFLSDKSENKLSTITLFEFSMKYFSIKCDKRLYILMPYIKDKFAFIIYGSTFRFMGDMISGRFSVIDVDKSIIMTQKRCWNKNGEVFEINISCEEQEIFILSMAICAAMYITYNGTHPVTI